MVFFSFFWNCRKLVFLLLQVLVLLLYIIYIVLMCIDIVGFTTESKHHGAKEMRDKVVIQARDNDLR